MKLGFIGLGIMGSPDINYMSRPLVRLRTNCCHWGPLMLKLRVR